MRGEAPADRQIATADRGLAMTHNLGGYPGEMVSFVSVVGTAAGLSHRPGRGLVGSSASAAQLANWGSQGAVAAAARR